MPPAQPKTTRIELRAPVRSANRIRYAAQLTRQSMSSFMLDAAEEHAEEIIASSEATQVPSDFFDAVWAAFDVPPRPNAALARKAKAQRRVTQR